MLDPRKLSPEDREAFHQAAEARVRAFKYEKPQDTGRPKDVIRLSRDAHSKLALQVIRNGGENNLHYHVNSDTNWMVLKGGARFYGPGDVLIAELGPNEGLFMPGGARYWFEKVGEDDLEILQMESIHEDIGDTMTRINVDQHKEWMNDTAMLKVY